MRVLCAISLLIAATSAFISTGCCHSRNFTVSDARDYGPTIRTKYRYWLVASDGLDFRENVSYLPEIFSEDGIPISISAKKNSWKISQYDILPKEVGDYLKAAYILLAGTTGGMVFPIFNGDTQEHGYEIKVFHENILPETLKVWGKNDHVQSGLLLPIAPMFLNGNPAPDKFKKGKSFETHKNDFMDTYTPNNNWSKAFAYGVASKLKEMEEKGIINDVVYEQSMKTAALIKAQRKKQQAEALAKQEQERRQKEEEARRKQFALEQEAKRRQLLAQQEAQRRQLEQLQASANSQQTFAAVTRPTYRLLSCEREAGSDFAYSFDIEFPSVDLNSIQMFGLIQGQLANAVRAMYVQSYSNTDPNRLVVDFPQYRLVNGHVLGRAVVLTIKPIKVDYDEFTRRGKLTVRFHSMQYEDARTYAKRNIETLARDKNIAITTGIPPPAATYYSLSETVRDGNILEIEFKTE